MFMDRLTLVVCLVPLGPSALTCAAEETTPPKQQAAKAEDPGILPPLLKPALPEPTVQVLFTKPEGAMVYWDISTPGAFDSPGLSLPGRQNFPASVLYRLSLLYRLRVTDLPGQRGVEFYPTLEITPISPRSEKFLAHNAVPVQFTSDDLLRAKWGIAVTKVIYLPDEKPAEVAARDVDTLVSFLMDPGVDPIIEADRRGVILAIVRISDVKVAETPAEAAAETSQPAIATTAVPASSSAPVTDARRWFARPGRVARESRRGWLWRR